MNEDGGWKIEDGKLTTLKPYGNHQKFSRFAGISTGEKRGWQNF